MKRSIGCFVGALLMLLTGSNAWAQAGATAQISGAAS
jgi:hypothetical protein